MTITSLKEHYKALLYSLIETKENPIDKPIVKPIPYSSKKREEFKKKLLLKWNKDRVNVTRPVKPFKFTKEQ
jgi:hypothetical protein